MTNSEIYDSLSKEIQGKIEVNCNNLNRMYCFDAWIIGDHSEDAISRAFVWNDSPEGHDYWSSINKEIEKLCDQE